MIRVGIVGLGFMGRMHYRCWKTTPGAEVVAICEANPKVLAAADQAQAGNIEGAADRIDLTGVKVFTDLDELLASGTVDALSITLPTFLHADTTCKALAAGVHVLCEKPMALSVDQCDRMTAAAEASGKVLQVGHCIRFWPEYVKTRELVQSGEYGAVIGASFRRFSATPSWSPDNWFADEQRSGGQPLDLHIHDSDYIHYLFGLPTAVSSVGDAPLSYISSQYHYGDGKAVVAESTWRMAQGFGFEMSFVIVLERATIVYDCTRSPAFRVCPASGESFTPEVPGGDGYQNEIAHFARVVAGEKLPPVVTPDQSRETVRLILAEKESARSGKRVAL
ncbi:MAG: Gfo/Idh/MocA family oxidoreductase [Isosphaeraceae bacterium]